MLPASVQESLFQFWRDELTLLEFEQWVYDCTELEDALGADDYLALIFLPFKQSEARHELRKLLRKHIDTSEIEKRRLLQLLHTAQCQPDELPRALIACYDLYCDGYYFLENLGLGYGLALVCDLEENSNTTAEQSALLTSFQPDLDAELARVINWLETGQLLPTGECNELGHWQYIDHRPASETAA